MMMKWSITKDSSPPPPLIFNDAHSQSIFEDTRTHM